MPTGEMCLASSNKVNLCGSQVKNIPRQYPPDEVLHTLSPIFDGIINPDYVLKERDGFSILVILKHSE